MPWGGPTSASELPVRPRRLLAAVPAAIVFLPAVLRAQPTYGVSVTPQNQFTASKTIQTTGYTQRFTIENTGIYTATFTITCGGASGVACTALSQTSVTVNPGLIAYVTATYSTGNQGTGGHGAQRAARHAQSRVHRLRDGDLQHREPGDWRALPQGGGAQRNRPGLRLGADQPPGGRAALLAAALPGGRPGPEPLRGELLRGELCPEHGAVHRARRPPERHPGLSGRPAQAAAVRGGGRVAGHDLRELAERVPAAGEDQREPGLLPERRANPAFRRELGLDPLPAGGAVRRHELRERPGVQHGDPGNDGDWWVLLHQPVADPVPRGGRHEEPDCQGVDSGRGAAALCGPGERQADHRGERERHLFHL